MKFLKVLRKKKGFTLIEVICVIAILGILIFLAVPQFTSIRDNAKQATTVASARATVSTILGATAHYEKDDWYAPRAGSVPAAYSEGSMNNYLEKVFEGGTPENNTHGYSNAYSDSRFILNWTSPISGSGKDPAVFLTNTTTYSFANSNESNMEMLKGTIVVYFATEGAGESMTTKHIEVYYTDENGTKSEKPFIIVL
ncbi:MAG: prepilin-type N-terminal cleavage/methylation domain-containing protein [Clostridia bacterium]|jgi:type IV pilus assembly protein PilA|nr:prepilin-type N-terminal cleavage/methylation domain-containing protein [Clostridia bacterium]